MPKVSKINDLAKLISPPAVARWFATAGGEMATQIATFGAGVDTLGSLVYSRAMTTKTTPVTLRASAVIGRPITWAQLSLAASEDLRGLIHRHAAAAQLILALIERMRPGTGGVVVVSRTTMAEILGASPRTIDRALATLAAEGWVQRMRIGGAFALAINSRVAWVGERDHLSHAIFAATVIASRTEQDAMALDPPPIRHVPTLQPGEHPLMVGPGQPPPSQPDLPGTPPVVAVAAADRVERPPMHIDPETGEIIPGPKP